MSTNAIDTGYKPTYYAEAKNIVSQGNTEEDVSIYNAEKTNTPKGVDVDYACTDGKDDGKLGIGETLASVGKGILKSAVNMVKAPFTEAAKGNFLPLIGVAAGAALMATPIGAPLAVIGGVIGIGKGLTDIISGVTKASEIANSADGTDGEAKAALEGVGSGILTTGLSALAVAGGVKSIKGRAKVFGETEGTKMYELNQKIAKGEQVSFGEKASAYASDSFKGSKFGKLTSKTESTTENSQQASGKPSGETNATPEQNGTGNNTGNTPDASNPAANNNPQTGQKPQQVEATSKPSTTPEQNIADSGTAAKPTTVKSAQAKVDNLQEMYNAEEQRLWHGETEDTTMLDQIGKELASAKQELSNIQQPAQAAAKPAATKPATTLESAQAKVNNLQEMYNAEEQKLWYGETEDTTMLDRLSKELANAQQELSKIQQPAQAAAKPAATKPATAKPAAQTPQYTTPTWGETLRNVGILAQSRLQNAGSTFISFLARRVGA